MRKLAVGLLALMTVAPAMAEPIPSVILEKDRRACVANRIGNQAIEATCLCYVIALSQELTLQRYLTIDSELRGRTDQGQSVTVAAREFPEIVRAKRSCGIPQ